MTMEATNWNAALQFARTGCVALALGGCVTGRKARHHVPTCAIATLLLMPLLWFRIAWVLGTGRNRVFRACLRTVVLSLTAGVTLILWGDGTTQLLRDGDMDGLYILFVFLPHLGYFIGYYRSPLRGLRLDSFVHPPHKGHQGR